MTRLMAVAVAVLVAVATWHAPALAAGADVAKMRIPDALVRDALVAALDAAKARLANPECEKVLTDFVAEDGRTLAEHLSDLQISAPKYVDLIWFLDGSRKEACGPSVFAFTQPGSRTVYICGDTFTRGAGTVKQVGASVVVIHEMLHSLGLGEGSKFPSSAAITRQVERRCAR